jgi:hypothetical protein
LPTSQWSERRANPPSLTFDVGTVTGKFYQAEYSDDLASGSWQPLSNLVAGTGSALMIRDPDAAQRRQRFYRIRILP